MTKQIVFADENSIRLSTSLKTNLFVKTNLATSIGEKGYIFTISKSNFDITCESWCFLSNIEDDDIAYFEGNGFTGSTPLSRSLYAYISMCYGYAIQNNIFLKPCGAPGVLYNEDSMYVRLLFLPGEIYERCAFNAGSENYAELQGYYINKALEQRDSMLFTRAVYAYLAFTGCLPFGEKGLSERQSDIYDNAFVPLDLWVKDIDADLKKSIHAGLAITAPERLLKGEGRIKNQSKQRKRDNLIDLACKLDEKKVLMSVEKTGEAEPDKKDILTEKRQSYVRKTYVKLSVKRFFRRNKTRITAFIIVIAVACGAFRSFEKENQKLVTTYGLTSLQTVEALYTQMHKADVPDLQEIIKGKNTKDLAVMITGFYVNIKQREAYSEKDGTVTTGQWLFFKNKSKFWQYGITNLTVDGKDASTAFACPVRGDRRSPITEENGIILEKNMTKQHTADYYFVHSDNDARIYVEKVRDVVTLTYSGKRWRVTDVSGKSSSVVVKTKELYSDYQGALDKYEGDIDKAVDSLRLKYPWLCNSSDLIEEAQSMIKVYNNTTAKQYLEKHL